MITPSHEVFTATVPDTSHGMRPDRLIMAEALRRKLRVLIEGDDRLKHRISIVTSPTEVDQLSLEGVEGVVVIDAPINDTQNGLAALERLKQKPEISTDGINIIVISQHEFKDQATRTGFYHDLGAHVAVDSNDVEFDNLHGYFNQYLRSAQPAA